MQKYVILVGAHVDVPNMLLKVPKREIFDRWDFPDFYTIKSLRVGDFGVKVKKNLNIFRGSFSAHAEHTRQALMRMLSIRISSLRVCSACASETKCGLALSKIKIIQ